MNAFRYAVCYPTSVRMQINVLLHIRTVYPLIKAEKKQKKKTHTPGENFCPKKPPNSRMHAYSGITIHVFTWELVFSHLQCNAIDPKGKPNTMLHKFLVMKSELLYFLFCNAKKRTWKKQSGENVKKIERKKTV